VKSEGTDQKRGDVNRSEVPVNPAIGLGKVGAEVAGLDASAQVMAERTVSMPDFFDYRADTLAHCLTGALGVRGGLAAAAANPHRRREFSAQELDFPPDPLRVAGIIKPFSFLEFGMQFAQPALVFGPGAKVERRTRIAKAAHSLNIIRLPSGARSGCRALGGGAPFNHRHQVQDVDSLARMRQQVREIAETFRIPEAGSHRSMHDRPDLAFSAENVIWQFSRLRVEVGFRNITNSPRRWCLEIATRRTSVFQRFQLRT
jgi:hypothetical protein